MSCALPSIRPHREAAGLRGGAETDEALARLFEAGRRAWPTLALAEGPFVHHVARHLPDGDTPRAHLDALHAADLYLACACGERLRGSVEAFHAAHGAALDAALRGLGLPPAQRDELCQALFEKLFVGRPGAPPKIVDYAGRGPLGAWVRVAAIRAARNALRQARHDRLGLAAPDAPPPSGAPDPELAFLKHHYRDEVQRALKAALADLALDERNVLRLAFLDGLGIDHIASAYGVHRATAARWLARGREALLSRTHALLGRRLRATPAEIEGIVALVRSQLDLTLESLFRSTVAREPAAPPAVAVRQRHEPAAAGAGSARRP
jgi:RNA polymerase sigma-70 factor, ECF subfamily